MVMPAQCLAPSWTLVLPLPPRSSLPSTGRRRPRTTPSHPTLTTSSSSTVRALALFYLAVDLHNISCDSLETFALSDSHDCRAQVPSCSRTLV